MSSATIEPFVPVNESCVNARPDALIVHDHVPMTPFLKLKMLVQSLARIGHEAGSLAMRPLLELLDASVNRLDVAEPVAHGVDPVSPTVHGHPAPAELSINPPMPRWNVRGILPPISGGEPESGFTEKAASIEGPVNSPLADAASALLGVGGDQSFPPCRRDDLLGCFDGNTDRLFAEDVDAAVQEFAREDVMQTVRTADVDSIDRASGIEEICY